MKELKNKLKSRIATIEYYNSGLTKINGDYVLVKDIKIKKRDNLVVADIIFGSYEDNKTERYNGCEFKLNELLKINI